MTAKQLFEPKYLFYISFVPQLLIVILDYTMSINIASCINNTPAPIRVPLIFIILIYSFILFFYMLTETSRNKEWLHFWLILLTGLYMWVYYIFFYKKGFNLYKKSKILIYGGI